MEFKEPINWIIILKLKELAHYLSINELNNICLNKEIRCSLKQDVFKELEFIRFELQHKSNGSPTIKERSVDILENQLKELEKEFSSIGYYVKNLKISQNFNHIAILNYSTKFPNLKQLHLFNIDLPICTLNSVLGNLIHLDCLLLEYLELTLCDVSDDISVIDLPNNLQTLKVNVVEFIKSGKMVNSLLQDTEDSYSYYDREICSFKSYNLPKLKKLIINDKSAESVNNIKFFLANNQQTIKFLSINVINFDSKLFTQIKECSNLTQLQLNSNLNSIHGSLPSIDYPKFTYIQSLQYNQSYTSYFNFDKSLLLSLPNLTTLECYYKKDYKNDLIIAINSLTKLKKLKLINWRSQFNFNFGLVSSTLKEITLEKVFILDFNLAIAENCSNLKRINLSAYDLKENNLLEVKARFSKFLNWKAIFFPKIIQMYSTSTY